MTDRRTLTRTALRILAGALALLVLTAGTAPAQEPVVDERADTTWEIRPDDGVAAVTVEVTLVNTTTDSPATRTFWDAWGLALPFEPDRVTVRQGDRVLDHEVSTLPDGTHAVTWDFVDDLDAGEQQVFVVHAEVDSAPPRSDWEDGPRISPSFVAAQVWAWGADEAIVTVRVPTGLDARLGSDEAPDTDGDVDVWRLEVDGTAWVDVLVGSADTHHVEEVVTVDGTEVTVRAWPSDPEWGRQVADFAAAALPLLAEWTGTPWEEESLAIEETATPFVEGWGGVNDTDANTIGLGEEYDRAVWTHELAHNWFGPEEFADVWLAEGLSDFVTAELAEDLGVEDPPAPDPTSLVLGEWDEVVVEADATRLEDPRGWDETIGDLYDGAHFVVATVADEVGRPAFREMVRMTLVEESVWDGPGGVLVPVEADWREFLTLAERVGGSTTARGLVLEHVAPDAAETLDQRDATLAAYDQLDTGPWATPVQVRRALQNWHFDTARADITRALALRAEIGDLADRAADLGVGLPDLREDWEVGTLTALTERTDALAGSLDGIAALATAADSAGLPVPALHVDPARDDLDTIDQRLANLQDAIARVAAAERRLDVARLDRLVQTGLLGSTPERTLEDATAALADGNVEQVAAATGQLDLLLDGARGRGRLRIGLLVGIVALLVLGTTLVLRRRRRGDDPSAGSGGADREGQPPHRVDDDSTVHAGG